MPRPVSPRSTRRANVARSPLPGQFADECRQLPNGTDAAERVPEHELHGELAHARAGVNVGELHGLWLAFEGVEDFGHLAHEVRELTLEVSVGPRQLAQVAEMPVGVGGQLVGVVESFDDAQDRAVDVLAVLLEDSQAEVGAVARAVQVDPGRIQRPAQVVDVVGALDGVVVVRFDAPFAPIRRQLASTRTLRIEEGLPGEHGVEVVARRRRVVEVRQRTVGAALVEGDHVADLGEPFDVFEEAGFERTDGGRARSAGQHDQRRQAVVPASGNAYERQRDSFTVVSRAARRHHEHAPFGIETAPARLREPHRPAADEAVLRVA